MGSDFNSGSLAAPYWRGDPHDSDAGIGEWRFDTESMTGSISAFNAEGESQCFIQFVALDDLLVIRALNPLREFKIRVCSFERDDTLLRFVAAFSKEYGGPILAGELTTITVVKDVTLNNLLTDEDGDVLTDENGDVLYEVIDG